MLSRQDPNYPRRSAMTRTGFMLLVLSALLGLTLSATVTAQDDSESGLGSSTEAREPRACPITLKSSEPAQITNGDVQVLTLRGTGFSDTTAIRLVGYGVLPTTLVNAEAITGDIPANIPAGVYDVRVIDSSCDNVQLPSDDKLFRLRLTVVNAPLPTPTFGEIEVPTPLPGAPALVGRNFSTSPLTIPPGGTVTLLFDVFNQGNRTAQGVSAAIEPGGSFLPAGGQLTTVLPDILPGGSASVALTAVAAQSAEPGPASIPVILTYRDNTGETYTTELNLSVSVERVITSTQLVLSRYQFSPDPAVPGEKVTLQVTVNNIGNTTAMQAVLRIGSEGVLLAGPQGDSFPLTDLLPGASMVVELPLVVKPDAKAGPQSQPFTITYLLNGEAQTFEGAMTVNVAQVVAQSPVMLLEAYTIDKDPLKPGEEFELDFTLKNVGDVTAAGLLVTFGTVESTGDGGGSGSGSGGSSTSTTPSTTFAPLGTGGTLFVGDVAAEATASFQQAFIVSGSVVSGVYSLPITLRYLKPDGTTAQDNLRASVVVIKPPALRVTLQSPVPEVVNVGEPITLAYEIANNGTTAEELTNATTETDNGEVVEGVETLIGDIAANDTGLYNAVVIPSEAGTINLTVRIRYLDDLNTEREIVETYTVEALLPPTPEEFVEPTPDLLIPTPTPEPAATPNNDWLGRLLLGLLGLGS